MKLLITGGAGFIGSNLVDELIKKGHQVIVIDNLSTGKVENINENAKFLKEDLFTISVDDLTKILTGVDYVFHLAAKARVQPSILEPISYNENNVAATLNLLEASKKSGSVKRVIFSSSSSVYGQGDVPFKEGAELNPMSPYALQKQIGEQYCKLYSKLYNLDTVCLRYFSVYGNRQPTTGGYCTVLGIFKELKNKNKILTITNDGEQKRDFTHVSDVVSANIMAMEFEGTFNGDFFNIGYGKSISINEIASYFGGEKKYIGNVIEPIETLADNSKAKKVFGWSPKIAINKELILSL